jgi:hypothetical protein
MARAREILCCFAHPRTLFTLPYDANLVVDSDNLQRRPQYWRGNGHAAGFARAVRQASAKLEYLRDRPRLK